MVIEIDEGSGFCFGVTRAIGKAEEELSNGKKLYCLGDIVHNGKECSRLQQLGLETIDHNTYNTLHDANVLLRAHGEPPSTYKKIKSDNISNYSNCTNHFHTNIYPFYDFCIANS